MADAKLVRDQPAKRAATSLEKGLRLQSLVEREPAAPAETPQPTGVPATVVGQLVRWIPTETITLYVAYLALLTPITAEAGRRICDTGDFTGRWVGLVVFEVVTVLFVLLIYVAKLRGTKQPFRWPLWEMAAAAVAFAAWALALPDTPLQSICSYKVEIGGFLVLATTIAITVVADALGRNVKGTT
jgi:hypothetical protein